MSANKRSGIPYWRKCRSCKLETPRSSMGTARMCASCVDRWVRALPVDPLKYRLQREHATASARLSRAVKRGDRTWERIERKLVTSLTAFLAQL